jgi:hypothetical protein
VLFPSRVARVASRVFRTLRDWLYVITVVGLLIALYGYLFKWRGMLHAGATLVIVANAGMFCVGLAYLISLPFKESLHHGLANLLIPPYAVYYWVTRWHRMRKPVLKTLGAFLPIALVGLAYLVYQEAPVVRSAVKRKVPEIEKRLENAKKRLPMIPGAGNQADTPPDADATDDNPPADPQQSEPRGAARSVTPF